MDEGKKYLVSVIRLRGILPESNFDDLCIVPRCWSLILNPLFTFYIPNFNLANSHPLETWTLAETERQQLAELLSISRSFFSEYKEKYPNFISQILYLQVAIFGMNESYSQAIYSHIQTIRKCQDEPKVTRLLANVEHLTFINQSSIDLILVQILVCKFSLNQLKILQPDSRLLEFTLFSSASWVDRDVSDWYYSVQSNFYKKLKPMKPNFVANLGSIIVSMLALLNCEDESVDTLIRMFGVLVFFTRAIVDNSVAHTSLPMIASSLLYFFTRLVDRLHTIESHTSDLIYLRSLVWLDVSICSCICSVSNNILSSKPESSIESWDWILGQNYRQLIPFSFHQGSFINVLARMSSPVSRRLRWIGKRGFILGPDFIGDFDKPSDSLSNSIENMEELPRALPSTCTSNTTSTPSTRPLSLINQYMKLDDSKSTLQSGKTAQEIIKKPFALNNPTLDPTPHDKSSITIQLEDKNSFSRRKSISHVNAVDPASSKSYKQKSQLATPLSLASDNQAVVSTHEESIRQKIFKDERLVFDLFTTNIIGMERKSRLKSVDQNFDTGTVGGNLVSPLLSEPSGNVPETIIKDSSSFKDYHPNEGFGNFVGTESRLDRIFKGVLSPEKDVESSNSVEYVKNAKLFYSTSKDEHEESMYILDTNILIDHVEALEDIVQVESIALAIPFVVLNEVSGLARQKSSRTGKKALMALSLITKIEDRMIRLKSSVCGLSIDGQTLDALDQHHQRPSERWPTDVRTTDEAIIRAAVNYRGPSSLLNLHLTNEWSQKRVFIVSDDLALGVMASAFGVPVFTWTRFKSKLG